MKVIKKGDHPFNQVINFIMFLAACSICVFIIYVCKRAGDSKSSDRYANLSNLERKNTEEFRKEQKLDKYDGKLTTIIEKSDELARDSGVFDGDLDGKRKTRKER